MWWDNISRSIVSQWDNIIFYADDAVVVMNEQTLEAAEYYDIMYPHGNGWWIMSKGKCDCLTGARLIVERLMRTVWWRWTYNYTLLTRETRGEITEFVSSSFVRQPQGGKSPDTKRALGRLLRNFLDHSRVVVHFYQQKKNHLTARARACRCFFIFSLKSVDDEGTWMRYPFSLQSRIQKQLARTTGRAAHRQHR